MSLVSSQASKQSTNMKSLIVLGLVGVACAQLRTVNVDNSGAYVPGQYSNVPTPYNFAYASDGGEGTHSHQETGDGQGRVQGSYTIQLTDGRTRTVNYVADENGYRAEVTTNELGTESRNPADVVITSSAITGPEAAIQYGPQAPPQRQQQITVAARPQTQIRQVNSQINLPSYGTFAGVPGRA